MINVKVDVGRPGYELALTIHPEFYRNLYTALYCKKTYKVSRTIYD